MARKGIRESDKKNRARCGVFVKKERECGIRTSNPPSPLQTLIRRVTYKGKLWYKPCVELLLPYLRRRNHFVPNVILNLYQSSNVTFFVIMVIYTFKIYTGSIVFLSLYFTEVGGCRLCKQFGCWWQDTGTVVYVNCSSVNMSLLFVFYLSTLSKSVH